MSVLGQFGLPSKKSAWSGEKRSGEDGRTLPRTKKHLSRVRALLASPERGPVPLV